MKVEVDVLGSPFLITSTVSVDVKQHRTLKKGYTLGVDVRLAER